MKKIFILPATALLIGVTMMLSSCSKKDDTTGCGTDGSHGTNATANKRIKELIKKLPLTKIINSGKYGAFKLNENSTNRDGDGGWTFSDPNDGSWTFSSDGGITYTTTTNTFYVSSSSFGSNSVSGGTVVAGGSTLDINYTFCFSADQSAYGLNLYDLDGNSFTGFSIVIGVSGDFDALAEADSTDNLFDFFHGLAFYIVYDSPASGDYKVVDWLDGLSGLDINSKKAFAYIFDFRDAKLYMSTSGKLNVSGGTMDFNGKYLEIAGFFDDSGSFDWDNPTYSIVPGFGAMGCN